MDARIGHVLLRIVYHRRLPSIQTLFKVHAATAVARKLASQSEELYKSLYSGSRWPHTSFIMSLPTIHVADIKGT